MLCEKCGIGYTFCGDSGICVANDPSCLSLSSDGVTCINCQLNYELVAGQCLAYGVGKQILPNGGMTCLAGYSPNGKECVRTRDSLVKLSLSSNVGYSYSSGSLLAAPNIGSTALWMPNSQLGEYLTIVTYDIPNIVFQVSIKGNDHGWVTAYIL